MNGLFVDLIGLLQLGLTTAPSPGTQTVSARHHCRRIITLISGERPVFLKVFEYPPEKTRKLKFYIRPVETRTTDISGGNNPRFVIHVAHVSFK